MLVTRACQQGRALRVLIPKHYAKAMGLMDKDQFLWERTEDGALKMTPLKQIVKAAKAKEQKA